MQRSPGLEVAQNVALLSAVCMQVAHKANSLVSCMVPLLPRKCDFELGGVPELMKLSAIAKNM